MRNKLLSFLNAIDPIFLPAKYRDEIYIAYPRGTPQEKFAKKIFAPGKLIGFSIDKKKMTDTDIILKNKNFNYQIKKKSINSYLLPHRQNPLISRWTKTQNLNLIGPDPKLQKLLEDKIYFDGLLKKYRISSPKTLKTEKDLKHYPPNRPLVVQASSSYGFFGTKLYARKSDYFKARKNKKTDFNSTLIREYVPGITVGVSLFIDTKGNYFCSGLRLQCFTYKDGFPKSFIGIQWLKTNDLSAQTRARLNSALKQLVRLLKAEKFFGLANFDLIINQKNIYILECNPRLSSATPQIFAKPELIAKNDAWRFLNETFSQKIQSQKVKRLLPKCTYQGALLDLDAEKTITIKNILPLGVYAWQKDRAKFLGPKLKNFSGQNRFFLYHDLPGKIKAGHFTVCTVISNFPMFNAKTGGLDQTGRAVYEYLKENFIV